MTAYREEDYLQLSGLQHFTFCRRQWALIHLEGQWAENLRTVEGDILHERAHDEGLSEKRGGLLTLRGLRIHSARLGVSGACDVVEFRHDPNGVPLHGREGLWAPCPVEYKRGKPKEGDEDRLQLCAQAMCLEEMLACSIPAGHLYYGETRRRCAVDFTPELRLRAEAELLEMHQYAARGHTPSVKPTKRCNACSLRGLCLPKLSKLRSAQSYLERQLREVSP